MDSILLFNNFLCAKINFNTKHKSLFHLTLDCSEVKTYSRKKGNCPESASHGQFAAVIGSAAQRARCAQQQWSWHSTTIKTVTLSSPR